MQKRSLRAALEAGEFVVAPGIHDMITAVVSNKVGFDFVYASGYWMTASAYGLPDAGIASYTQMLDRMATLCRTVNAAVIDRNIWVRQDYIEPGYAGRPFVMWTATDRYHGKAAPGPLRWVVVQP